MAPSIQELQDRLRDEGFLWLPNVLSDADLAQCRERSAEHVGEILRSLLLTQLLKLRSEGESEPARFAECVERDGGRLDVRHEPGDAVFMPIVNAAGSGTTLGDLLHATLGDAAEAVAAGNVVAMSPHGWLEAGLAGDEDEEDCVVLADSLGEQSWHADGPHLFEDEGLTLPPHAFTCFFPMVDLTEENGPTEFVPGSHVRGREYSAASEQNRPTQAPLARAGDCVLFDYRLWHRGLPNRSDADRPVLYLVVGKPWWTDSRNYRQEKSLFPAAGAQRVSEAGRSASKPTTRKLPALGVLPQRVRLRKEKDEQTAAAIAAVEQPSEAVAESSLEQQPESDKKRGKRRRS